MPCLDFDDFCFVARPGAFFDLTVVSLRTAGAFRAVFLVVEAAFEFFAELPVLLGFDFCLIFCVKIPRSK